MKVQFLEFPAQIQEVIQTTNGLKQALHRLEVGTPDTPRSWVYENVRNPEQTLVPIVSQLQALRKDLKIIADWDLSKSGKFRPQGGSAPLAERLESFNEYFEHLDSPQIIKDPVWKQAKRNAVKTLRFNESGRPIALKAVLERGLTEDKYNTSSGYPLYVKRKRPEAIQQTLAIGDECIALRYPSTLGTRATMGKTGEDARNIFMAAMSVNAVGQQYQMPLQDYIRSLHLDFFRPWEGWEHCQSCISAHWDGNVKFGADYTKMDQHFNAHHAEEVYDVIKHYYSRNYWDELHRTIQYVFVLPIVTNLGYVNQTHAMPSGSEWTNFLETLWNFIFVEYLKLKWHLPITCSMGIGDDQLYFISADAIQRGLAGKPWSEFNAQEKVRAERWVSWVIDIVINAMDQAGLPGNPEKQEVGFTHTTFLQRMCCDAWNGHDGKMRAAGVYSLVRNWTSEMFPERYHNEKEWDADMFAQRCVMICENTVQHPCFRWYCSYLLKSNSNIAEWVRRSDSELQSTQERSRAIAGFLPTYNQEKMDRPIYQYETVRVMRELLENS